MSADRLPKITKRKKKRVGRGYGSGKGGHTSGRGAKGQKARSKVKIWFEGGQLATVRRMPKTRGKGRFKPLKASPVIINLRDLKGLKKGVKVTIEELVERGLVKKEEVDKFGIKLLGQGESPMKMTLNIPASKSAREKIVKAGGKVE